MNLEELLQEAKDGNMVAQYDLAEQYGRRLKETDREDEIKEYSRQAVYWLKQSARQGYGPAVDAVRELNIQLGDTEQMLEEMTANAQAELPDREEDPVEAASVPEQKLSGDTRVMRPIASKAEGERSAARDERARADAVSRTNVLLAVMLGVSLLLNIFLLVFMFRMLKTNDRQPDPQAALSASALPESPSADPTEKPSPSLRPTLTPDVTAKPTATPTPEPTEEPGFWLDLSPYTDLEVVPPEEEIYDDYIYYSVQVSTALNMRSGPGTSYALLGTIPNATKVGAVAKDGTWYLVYYDGKFGWVSSGYLTTDLS